ncbi:venom allergen 5.01-like isoform X2 [Neocloeon triangulifer]|uniref:venom allergen 5.01-like isoform X2 n=1 Tax=Neocloeon triangulifer TaxID=2078957 RepID=UPI00286F3446|nr:venom allergen 5.01-like isoform X2 [Neocloeon triangulifer]
MALRIGKVVPLMLFIIFTLGLASGKVDHCELRVANFINPSDPNDIPCMTRNACKPGHIVMNKDSRLNKLEQNAILHVINKLRSFVASGHAKGQPRAKNMNQLEWSADLADLARMYAEQCDNPNSKFFDKDLHWLGHYDIGKLQSETQHAATEKGDELKLQLEPYFLHTIYRKAICEGFFDTEKIKRFHRPPDFLPASYAYAQADPGHNQNNYLVCFFGPGIPLWTLDSTMVDKWSATIYDAGDPKCKVPSSVYPSLCASNELNEIENPCSDEEFYTKYTKFCSDKIYEKICEHHATLNAESSNWYWYIMIIFPVATVVAAVWHFREDIEDFLF